MNIRAMRFAYLIGRRYRALGVDLCEVRLYLASMTRTLVPLCTTRSGTRWRGTDASGRTARAERRLTEPAGAYVGADGNSLASHVGLPQAIQ
ncbi:Hypothetical protein A7982_00500 [Minicystis rosea]|nr:Hypothetical protein A7982_00500 [Minicystis rosea]